MATKLETKRNDIPIVLAQKSIKVYEAPKIVVPEGYRKVYPAEITYNYRNIPEFRKFLQEGIPILTGQNFNGEVGICKIDDKGGIYRVNETYYSGLRDEERVLHKPGGGPIVAYVQKDRTKSGDIELVFDASPNTLSQVRIGLVKIGSWKDTDLPREIQEVERLLDSEHFKEVQTLADKMRNRTTKSGHIGSTADLLSLKRQTNQTSERHPVEILISTEVKERMAALKKDYPVMFDRHDQKPNEICITSIVIDAAGAQVAIYRAEAGLSTARMSDEKAWELKKGINYVPIFCDATEYFARDDEYQARKSTPQQKVYSDNNGRNI